MIIKNSEKLNLVAKAQAPDSTCYKVSLQHDIKYTTIKKYYQRVDKGLPLFEKEGRPPKLDSDGENLILSYMRANADWNRYKLYPLVKLEAKRTAQRRYPQHEPPLKEMRISRSSLRRHTTRIIELFTLELLEVDLNEDNYWSETYELNPA